MSELYSNQNHLQNFENALLMSEMCDPPSCDNLQETIDWLQSIGLPPLPESPIEADRQGKAPKQPHYLGKNGIAYGVQWKPWQEKQPPEELLKQWFLIPRGIGTLAKFNGKHWITWIDIDRKTFKNSDCDEVVTEWEEKYPILEQCPMFRSPSGGYRYMIALSKEPENFKSNSGFSLSPDGVERCGELLAKNGGHTLLPPTVSVNGAYIWERFCPYPPVVEKPEDIGIYPLKKVEKSKPVVNETKPENNFTTESKSDLNVVIDEINSKVDFEKGFNWEGHNFQYESADKVKGYCPWHDSNSGTAFYAERVKGTILWRCPACDIGGNIINYRSLLNGGNGKPRGKEFINIVQELCSETGVVFPERNKNQSKNKKTKENIVQPTRDVNEVTDYARIATAEPKDEWEMTTTSDRTIYQALFQNGEGDWAVIDDAFYQYSIDICSGIAYWKHVDDRYVNHLIAHALMDVYKVKKTPEGEEIRQYIYANNRNKESAFKYSKSALSKKKTAYNNYYIAFFNCTVDLRTGEQLPHEREHYCIHAVGANYTPNMQLPEVFKTFLDNAFGEELIELIRALTRMLLDTTIPYGYFPHVLGSSGSGKGTLIRLWGSLIGEGGVRSLTSFRELATPEGRHQNLSGVKLINLPDVGGFQNSLQAFYELVDNGTMSGRALFSSYGYERQWNCRFAMASVNYLGIENSGDGWERRCIPLPTKRRQGAVDPDLGRKLQQVKGEIISWALAMDREECVRLITNSVGVTEKISELKREQAIHSDSIRAFVDMCLSPSEDKNATLEKSKLHEFYVAYCKAHGFQSSSYNKFVSHMKMVLPNNHVDRKFKRTDGKREIIPSHFYHIKAISKVFTTTANFDPPITHCWKEFCREGGLDLFDDFWLNRDTGLWGDTGLAQGQNSYPVSAGTLTEKEIPRLAQVAHPQEEILHKENGSTSEKVAGQEDDFSENDDLNLCNYVENFSTNPVPPCATSQEPCTVKDSTWHRIEKNDPVPPCATPQTCVTQEPLVDDADPRIIAAQSIAKILESIDATWQDIKEVLEFTEIAVYTQLQGFLSIPAFKKLEMLIPVEQRELNC